MEVLKRTLTHRRPPLRRIDVGASFNPPRCTTDDSAGSLHYLTDDQMLLHVLERCKATPDLRTANSIHGKIIKYGYEIYPRFISMLITIYISCEQLNHARRLLGEICFVNFGLIASNLLIDSFMKVGEFDTAKKIFSSLTARDVVTWNSTIGGCVKNGYLLKAVSMFKEMLKTNFEPDGYTFASVITACSRLGAISIGQWVHDLMIERRIQPNYILSSALIDMYSRCGRIERAKSIFNTAQRTDVSVWNAMINGLAIHGFAVDALSLFSNMEIENILPDPITFIGILTACSHCGFVDQGRYYFYIMQKDYSIRPQLEHYGAMVDLLGRAGLLEEAYTTIQDMPIDPDSVTWRALLSACKTHKNYEIGEIAVGKINDHGSGDYVLLSNMYCSTSKWDDAEKVRHVMSKKGVRKSSGRSWIELHGVIHHFKAGDRRHPEAEAVYRVLKTLIHRTRMEGFVVCAQDLVFMDVSEEEKDDNLNYHSEKLAVAYGILKTSPGTEILISNNLRTCIDCHSWMKVVSKVLNRVVLVRDRLRFHRFERGSCSCGDYW